MSRVVGDPAGFTEDDMTSTTTRWSPHQPWPTRREREGGPARRPAIPATASTVSHTGPRHAAADPDVTERPPIVVPRQRSPAEIAAVPASRPTPALGGVGTVAFVQTPDRLVYDSDALTAPAAVVTRIGE